MTKFLFFLLINIFLKFVASSVITENMNIYLNMFYLMLLVNRCSAFNVKENAIDIEINGMILKYGTVYSEKIKKTYFKVWHSL